MRNTIDKIVYTVIVLAMLGLIHDDHRTIADLKEKVDIINYTPIEYKNAIVDVSIKGAGGGTGVVIQTNENGTLILTAAHIASNYLFENVEKVLKRKVTITTDINVDSFKGEIIKVNYIDDIAILKIKEELNMKPIPIAKEYAKLGDTVWALSQPLNYNTIYTKSVISQFNNFKIVSTSAVMSGSSGGALLNGEGELIGIIVSEATRPSKIRINGKRVMLPTIYSSSADLIGIQITLQGVEDYDR